MSRRRAARGYSLIEVVVVLAIVSLVASAGIPRVMDAGERSRCDSALATLHSILVAERMYRLETGTFTSDLQDLVDLRLLDAAVVGASDPFAYSVAAADATTVLVEADRDAGGGWSGTFQMDASGAVSGTVSHLGGVTIDATPYQ